MNQKHHRQFLSSPRLGSGPGFLLAVGLILAVMLAGGIYINRVVFDSVQKTYTELVSNIADQGQMLLDGYLHSQYRLMDLYSRVPSVRRGTFADLPQWLVEGSLDSVIPRRFSLIDAQGRGVSSDGGTFYAGDRKYFKEAIETGKGTEGPLVSRIDGANVMVIAQSMHPDKSQTSVLSAAIDLSSFERILEPVVGLSGAIFQIMANDGATIMAFEKPQDNPGQQKLFASRGLKTIPATLTVQVKQGNFMKPLDGAMLSLWILSLTISGLVTWAFLRALKHRQQYFLDQVKNLRALQLAHKRIKELAFLDPVTSLPNRNKAIDKISLAIKDKLPLWIVLVEIRSFSLLSATYGIHFADKVLRQTAKRLSELTGPIDKLFLGRITGTEFLLLVPERNYAQSFNKQLILLFEPPLGEDDLQVHIAVQIGACRLSEAGTTPDEVLKRSQAALLLARDKGPNQWAELTDSIVASQARRTLVQSKILQGWKQNEFQIYYQAQVSALDGSIRGYEALLRWKSADLGWVGPAEFIPLTEESGFIVSLGKWVLSQGINFALELQKRGIDATVSINVSPVQLLDQDFLERVIAMVNEAGLSPERLGLEFTESVIIHGIDQLRPSLNRIMAMGIKISLDDFGTGFSSLTTIKDLPINVLKLDKAFIDDLEVDPKAFNIAQSLVELAHHIGLEVIAEGVENSSQLTMLQKMGCDCVQGYLTGRPVDGSVLLKKIGQLV